MKRKFSEKNKVRTIEEYFEDNLKVRIQISNQNMPDLIVTPSKASFNNTGGLCGMWDSNSQRELYVLDKDGNEEYLTNTNETLIKIKEFWQYIFSFEFKAYEIIVNLI